MEFIKIEASMKLMIIIAAFCPEIRLEKAVIHLFLLKF